MQNAHAKVSPFFQKKKKNMKTLNYREMCFFCLLLRKIAFAPKAFFLSTRREEPLALFSTRKKKKKKKKKTSRGCRENERRRAPQRLWRSFGKKNFKATTTLL